MPTSACQILLDDGRPGEPALRRFVNPKAIIEINAPSDVTTALAEIGRAVQAGYYAAGYLSYELGYALEQRLLPHLWPERREPLLWFGIFDACDELDAGASATLLATEARAYAGPLQREWDMDDYSRRFTRAHALIAAGDLYQVNLSFRAPFAFLGSPLALYCRLRSAAEASHCAFIDDGTRQILSLSPELFFDLSPSRLMTARPMKGTAARGADPAADAAARAALVASEKDRAENLMIVDLLRNDLGRIAEIGTVKAKNLFSIESYPTLHQMTSTITATLKSDTSVEDIVRALFPCGSVTGAPKIRAMEVISELEASPRGVYCGSIGYFSPDGSARFNVAIRTLTVQGSRGELGVGGAVTYDSNVCSEYDECLLKALYYERTRRPLELVETLHYSPIDKFARIDRHLARMARSASAFGITFNECAARHSLHGAVGGSDVDMRVRLTLGDDGSLTCSAVPLECPPNRSWTYVVSSIRVNSNNIFQRHKTNWRELYENEYRQVAQQQNADEVLFLNERGELTEGSRTNLFIERDGKLLTPPLACGLLNGCLRSAFIEEGRCVEAILAVDDLRSADAVFLGNSLRGLIKARPRLDIT